jgi:hypothetical protein
MNYTVWHKNEKLKSPIEKVTPSERKYNGIQNLGLKQNQYTFLYSRFIHCFVLFTGSYVLEKSL